MIVRESSRYWFRQTVRQLNHAGIRRKQPTGSDQYYPRLVRSLSSKGDAAAESTSSTKSKVDHSQPPFVMPHQLRISPSCKRLPKLSSQEFSSSLKDEEKERSSASWMALQRIAQLSFVKVIEPPTLHLLAASACATMGIAALEASLLLHPHVSLYDLNSLMFISRYAVEQLFPSVVWQTQPATMIATVVGLDPTTLLADLSGETPASARLLLQTHLLETSRYFFAGFMMIAQLFRAGAISMEGFSEYEQRIQRGREPPLLLQDGLVMRLCGKDSFVSAVTLSKMGRHFFPIFESPERVQWLVWKYSQNKRLPVFWCVEQGRYTQPYSWARFPVGKGCFYKGVEGEQLLFLEADATNGNDPLTIGKTALDLTLDDASQGFNFILKKFEQQGYTPGKDFRPVRVYLGNSMEEFSTGGGFHYNIRHRIRFANECDILVDSRAPVLQRILEWCEQVAGKDRKLIFQTTSRDYFVNLQKLLWQYGYEVYDPIDVLMVQNPFHDTEKSESPAPTSNNLQKEHNFASVMSQMIQDSKYSSDEEEWTDHGDFVHNLYSSNHPYASPSRGNSIQKENGSEPKNKMVVKDETVRAMARFSKLPRLIHMTTTAQTVNAVEAMIVTGALRTSHVCALVDREEGVAILERTLERKSGYKRHQETRHKWVRQSEQTSHRQKSNETGLEIICSSSIHDDALRQVRKWACMGYTSNEIQREMDAQFHQVIQQSHAIQAAEAEQTQSDKEEESDTIEAVPQDGEIIEDDFDTTIQDPPQKKG